MKWKFEVSGRADVWVFEGAGIRAIVVFGHVNNPEQWVLSCYRLGIDTVELKGCRTADEAKVSAEKQIRQTIKEILQSLDA